MSPTQTHLAAGAVRMDEYDFFKEQVVRHIVLAGKGLPADQRTYELTNWTALDDFAEGLVSQGEAG